MHIYFSGIGGTGIGPLALIAHQAGFLVSGSDKQTSTYTNYLNSKGINLHIGQDDDKNISQVHHNKPIDWFVYSSALPLENKNHPELKFINKNGIKHSKRDEFLAYFLKETGLQMLAAAGTHGKTTTTAMLIWVMNQLSVPISYSLGAKTSFCEMGHYEPTSKLFIYECDEFDKNFLSFYPEIAVISSLSWDHHEIYNTEAEYFKAFEQFISQANKTIIFEEDFHKLALKINENHTVISTQDKLLSEIKLAGLHNRKNARLVIELVAQATSKDKRQIIEIVNNFPGVSRRFEKLANNIYTDYAHTPEEIEATLQLASELGQPIVSVYEPLTNRRQHFMKEQYKNSFKMANKIYWLPSYLAREDPSQTMLTPNDLIGYLNNRSVAQVAEKNNQLWQEITQLADDGYVVILLAGGGGGSLDEWARNMVELKSN